MILVACGGGSSGGLPQAAGSDETGPKILTIEPIANEIDVSVGSAVGALSTITVTFDEVLNRDSLIPTNVLIQGIDANGSVIPNLTVGLISPNPFNYIEAKNTLIITTESNGFVANQDYQIKIKNFVDELGNKMAEFNSRFSTTRAPSVVSVTPADDSVASFPVSTAQKIIVEFDEVMDSASLKAGFSLTEVSSNSTATKTYKFNDTNLSLLLDHQVSNGKSTATYSLLDAGTQAAKLLAQTSRYTVNLLATTTDLKGNNLIPFTSTFVTGVSTQVGTPAAKPGIVTAITANSTTGTLENKVTWPVVANTAYYLYVSKNGSLFTQIITTPAPLVQTLFIDKNITTGASYIYAVSAVQILGSNSFGPESEYSKSKLVVAGAAAPLKLTAIAGPNETNSINDGDVLLSWDSISGNTYKLYVKINNSAFSVLKPEIIAIGTTTTYTVLSPGNDQRYTYQVSVVNPNNVESAKVTSAEVVPFGPPPVASVLAVGANQSVKVTWPILNKVPGLSYSVYVKVGNDPNAPFSTTPIAQGLTVGQLVHGIDTSPALVNGTAYTYKVFAVSTASGISRTTKFGTISNEGLAAIPTPPPPAPNVSATAGDASVTITWNLAAASLNYDYRIFKKAKTESVYSYVTLLTKPSIGSFTMLISNNISYTYQVAAVDNNVEGIRGTSNEATARLIGSKISSWYHSCVIKAGDLYCWGQNDFGQLGNGVKSFAEKKQLVTPPVDANGLTVGSSWIAVATGQSHTCGIRNSGDMFCWGAAGGGQLGVGDSTASILPPQQVNTPAILVAANEKANWTQVTAGRYYTCGIHRTTSGGGQLFCWGRNDSDQLGIVQPSPPLTIAIQPEPVTLGNDSANNWVEVKAGSRHTCGIRQQTLGSTLWCWGERRSGKLGDNNSSLTPLTLLQPNQVVSTLNGGINFDLDWSSVALGKYHTCGIRGTSNTLWCWGSNGSGQLGSVTDGSGSNLRVSFVPFQVLPPSADWLKVFANNLQTCGIKTTGETFCWGKNESGELGIGSINFNEKLPISTSAKMSEVALGFEYSCAITGALGQISGVSCWGNAEKFALGSSTTSETFIPKQVETAQDWFDVSLSSGIYFDPAFTLGLRTINTNNVMFGAGQNTSGVLSTGNSNLIQQQFLVSGSSGFLWQKVTAGKDHACGLHDNNTIYCWGAFDRLGSASSSSDVPVQVGAETWFDISAAKDHTCAIKLSDKSLWCWGSERYGKLGAGQDLTTNPATPNKPDIANGVYLIQVLEPDTATPGVATKWQSVSAGGDFTCAIDQFSSLYCWGRNSAGQLGIDNLVITNAYIPTQITTIAGVTWTKVSSGYQTACATTNGASENLYCWGYNGFGTVGNFGTTNQAKPTVVSVPGTWTDINVNAYHACARQNNSLGSSATVGALWCWGLNEYGQLGDNTYSNSNQGRTTPGLVSGGQLWKRFSTGYSSTCAIRDDDSLWCWGRNFDGELATNNAWKTRPVPVTFP